MKKFILFFLLVSLQAKAQVGFIDPRDPSVPTPLKDAAESVYEVRTAFISDLTEYSDVKVVDISSDTQKNAVLELINSLPSPYDHKDKAVMRAFIQRCERSNNKTECIVPTSLNSGSGFITGNGSTFWTNAHVLEKMLKTKELTDETTISDLLNGTNNMPVFIFNKNGDLVFDGLSEEVKFKATPALTNLTAAEGNFFAVDSDYVAIDLQKILGAPLKVAQNKSLSGEVISVIGYPSCTGCKAPEGMDEIEYLDRGQGRNAENCLEKIAVGTTISTQNFGDLAQVNNALINMLDQESFIASTADSQHGMSGGPILNQNGEVVGIHTGGKSVVRNGTVARYSRGVIPPTLKNE